MVLVTTGLLACSEEEYRPLRCSDYEKTPGLPKTPITYTTEHLDIHVEEGLMFCAGSAAEYERFFMYMGSQLDIDLPERVPIFSWRASVTLAHKMPAGAGLWMER
jgi:hypothetical protein